MINESNISPVNSDAVSTTVSQPGLQITNNIPAQIPYDVAKKPALAEKIIQSFFPFGFCSFLYGIFFCICLYRNVYGITSPILCIGTLAYYFYCFKSLGVTASKKQSTFFSVSICLLGLSNMLTSSWILIFMNYIGIILLVFCFVLQFFYDTKKWDFSKYMLSLIQTIALSITQICYPFTSFSKFLKENKSEKSRKIYQVLLGLIISIPLLMIVGSLLMSADMVFRHFSDELLLKFFTELDFSNCIIIVFLFFIGMIASYCILVELASDHLTHTVKNKKTMEPLIAITFTSILSVLYLLFSVIQIVYLFIGNMTLPENYTYAQYAREGFFELLFVCFINLFLVLFCMKHYQDNRVLKTILTLICLCTFIMIASSTMRMLLYIDTYHLTFLRVFVLLSLAILFICLCGIIVSIYKESFPLFSYMLIVVTVSYVLFSLSRPDTFIAAYNLAYSEEIDQSYLYDLSYDALPAIEKAGLFEKEQVQIPADFNPDIFDMNPSADCNALMDDYWSGGIKAYALRARACYNNMSPRKFNLSVYLAGQSLNRYCK